MALLTSVLLVSVSLQADGEAPWKYTYTAMLRKDGLNSIVSPSLSVHHRTSREVFTNELQLLSFCLIVNVYGVFGPHGGEHVVQPPHANVLVFVPLHKAALIVVFFYKKKRII